jgi:prolyl oligopeptidase
VFKGRQLPGARRAALPRQPVRRRQGRRYRPRVRHPHQALRPGGFTLPEGKHRISWLDRDTLLVATDFGPGTSPKSGYPYIVKALKRGQTLAQAPSCIAARPNDRRLRRLDLRAPRPEGVYQGTVIQRPLDTFNAEYHTFGALEPAAGAFEVRRMDLPAKASLHGWHEGRLLFTTGQDWNGFTSGSLLASAFVTEAGPGPAPVITLFTPTPRQAVEDVAITADRVVAVIYDEVRGRLMSFDMGSTGATRADIPLPDNSTITLSATSKARDQMLVNVQGFVTPSTLFLADAKGGQPVKLKALPDRFNAANATVEQFTATSRDGTRIPYFVTRPKRIPASARHHPVRLRRLRRGQAARLHRRRWASCG